MFFTTVKEHVKLAINFSPSFYYASITISFAQARATIVQNPPSIFILSHIAQGQLYNEMRLNETVGKGRGRNGTNLKSKERIQTDHKELNSVE